MTSLSSLSIYYSWILPKTVIFCIPIYASISPKKYRLNDHGNLYCIAHRYSYAKQKHPFMAYIKFQSTSKTESPVVYICRVTISVSSFSSDSERSRAIEQRWAHFWSHLPSKLKNHIIKVNFNQKEFIC